MATIGYGLTTVRTANNAGHKPATGSFTKGNRNKGGSLATHKEMQIMYAGQGHTLACTGTHGRRPGTGCACGATPATTGGQQLQGHLVALQTMGQAQAAKYLAKLAPAQVAALMAAAGVGGTAGQVMAARKAPKRR